MRVELKYQGDKQRMSEKNILEEIAEKKKRTYPEGKTSVSPGSAENPGRKSTTAAVLSGSVEKAGYVLHL